MVTKFVPSPANSGGRLRSAAVARRLRSVSEEMVLCCFDDGSGRPADLEALGIEVRTVPWRPRGTTLGRGILRTQSGSAGRFWDPALAAVVRQALTERPTDVLQVEYSQLGAYLDAGPARTKVLDFHNIESSLLRSYATSATGPKARLARLEARALERHERIGAEKADLVVVVSAKDGERLPGSPREVLVCKNGWEPTAPLPPADEPVAAFVALMGWQPNVDAALWLAREVWPRVRARMPAARLLLVGRDPTPAVRALAGPDIEVTGTVPAIGPYLARSRVAVAPLRAGGGTRLKVLEALDAGRPVIGTSMGLEQLEDLIGCGAYAADDPAEFADRLLELLADGPRAADVGRQGHESVAERYGWDRVLAPWLSRITAA